MGDCYMLKTQTNLFLFIMLFSWACSAQRKVPGNLILKVDEALSGPFVGQKSTSCLRVYSDGTVLYASWWNSAVTLVDKETGQESRPEHVVAVVYHLEDNDQSDLSSFLE